MRTFIGLRNRRLLVRIQLGVLQTTQGKHTMPRNPKKPQHDLRNDLRSTIGRNVAHYRQAAGWTQAELADRLHIHRISVSRLETGDYLPSLELAFLIADLFRIAADDLRTLRTAPAKSA